MTTMKGGKEGTGRRGLPEVEILDHLCDYLVLFGMVTQ